MFEDILGIDSSQLQQEKFKELNFEGCPFCGAINVEEDGVGKFPHAKQFDQPMICNTCGGRWTVEYDEDLEIKNVDY